MALDHAGDQPEPGARPLDQAAARGARGDQPAERRARRGRLPAPPVEAPAPLLWLDWSGARVSSVDLTLVGDYDEPRRRVRLRAATTKTRRGALGRAPPGARRGARGALGAARGSATPRRGCSPSSGADALRTAIAKACKAAGIPLWSPARPPPPADLAAAPARRAVGADRRVRRPARPDRDREHLHARAHRRDASSTTPSCSRETGRARTGVPRRVPLGEKSTRFAGWLSPTRGAEGIAKARCVQTPVSPAARTGPGARPRPRARAGGPTERGPRPVAILPATIQ